MKLSFKIFGICILSLTMSSAFALSELEVVDQIHLSTGIDKKDIRRGLSALSQRVQERLNQDGEITLRSIGKLKKAAKKNARTSDVTGEIYLNEGRDISIIPSPDLLVASFDRYFSTFISDATSEAAKLASLEPNPLFKETAHEVENPLYEMSSRPINTGLINYASLMANSLNIIAKTMDEVEPYKILSDHPKAKESRAELIQAISRGHEAAHVVQQASGRELVNAYESLFDKIDESLELDEKASGEEITFVAERLEMKMAPEQFYKMYDALTKLIHDSVRRGEEVELSGIGSIANTARAAGPGRNPQTGKEIQIAANSSIVINALHSDDLVVRKKPGGTRK